MRIENITLIVPPLERSVAGMQLSNSIVGTRKYPSLGLGYIAAVLEEAGYLVQFIDMFAEELNLKNLLSRLKKSPPSVVGITTDMVTFVTAKKIATFIKHEFPDCYLIFGGALTTIYPKDLLLNNLFDAMVRGEGEITIIELIEALKKDKPLKDVKGLSYRENGAIYVNEDRLLIKNLDKLPFPARHLMPMDKYYSVIAKKGKFTTLISSRGCPYSCTYCLEQGTLRIRNPKAVVDELELVVQEYGITEFFFQDSTFSVNQKNTTRICQEIINRKLEIKWECKTRVDSVTKDLLKLMRKSGCARIHYGVESGNSRILKVLNKQFTLKQAMNAINWTKDVNIEILAYFIIGSPSENLRTIKDTIQFAKKLDPDFALFSIALAGPGMPWYEMALKQNKFENDYGREFLIGNLKEIPKIYFTTKEYDRKALIKILRKAYFQFYFRPRILLKRLRKIQSREELLNNLQGVWYLIKSLFEKF